MEYQSIGKILSGILLLIGILLAIYYKLDVIGLAYVYLIVSIIILGYSFIIFIKKFSMPNIRIDWNFWKPTIKDAWPFALISLSGMLYTYFDSIILSILKGSEVVGWYSAAYGIMMLLLFIPNAVNMAIFPIMSRYYTSSKDSIKMMHEKYFKYMIMIGIPIGAGTTILADKIIPLIFGQGYSQSIIILQILIWTIVITFAGASFVQILQSTNKQLIITKISGICLIINIILNLILIPKYSYIGASFATFITEIILVGYIIFASYKLGYGLNNKIVINYLTRISVATLIMSTIIWYLHDLNLFILVIMGTLVYFSILYFIKGINEEDLYLLNEILSKN